MALLARIISRVFDPFIMLTALFALTFIRGGQTDISTWLVSFGLMIAVPVILIIIAIRKNIVSDWDITKREERPRVLWVVLILELINVFLLRPFVSPWVTQVLVGVFVILFGFTLVTLRWKISGHALSCALFSGALVSWYGWGWWPVLMIVPVVGWARVVTKKHTLLQVVAGSLYAFASFFVLQRVI